MSQSAQVPVPPEVQEFIKALDEVGVKYIVEPVSKKIMIKGKVRQLGHTEHYFEVWIYQGRSKRLIISQGVESTLFEVRDTLYAKQRTVRLTLKVTIIFFEKYLIIEYGP
jgi:hypothetical protein